MSSSLSFLLSTVYLFKIITVLFFFFPFGSISAAEPLDVVINEISWTGTKASYNDEWIELYNNKSEFVSLDGWVLKTEDETPKIILTGEIPPYGFYILERTDDNTLPNLPADKIYTGNLENAGEFLKLLDDTGILIDSINCFNGWFAGDNSSKQTMERKSSGISGDNLENWQTSRDPGGTPKTVNSEDKIINNDQEAKEELTAQFELLSDISAETATISKNYPIGIVINELLPSPEGSDEKNEWIEIFNQNDFEVNIFDWKLKDSVGKVTNYTFAKETIIKAKSFLILYRPVTKIVLNNDEDKITLLKPNEEVADEIYYQKAPQGQSFNRFNSNWLWSSKLTPGSTNDTTVSSLSGEETETEKKERKEINPTLERTFQKVGAIGKQLPKNKNPLFVLLIALTVAFLSGTAFFLIKKSLIISKKDF